MEIAPEETGRTGASRTQFPFERGCSAGRGHLQSCSAAGCGVLLFELCMDHWR
jgi:hypothetical protein